METLPQISLTHELLAAVHAGDGVARIEDPSSHRVFLLIEEGPSPSVDDEYVREKIDEAYTGGQFEPLHMNAVKTEFERRQAIRDGQRI